MTENRRGFAVAPLFKVLAAQSLHERPFALLDSTDAICALLVGLQLSPTEAAQLRSIADTSADAGSLLPSEEGISGNDVPTDSDSTAQPAITVSPPAIVPQLLQGVVDTPAIVPQLLQGVVDTPAIFAVDQPVPTPVEINGALTVLPHLPISTISTGGEVRYQQTYHGFKFDVPRAGSAGPFYVVTRGTRVGVFSTWQHTSGLVVGISRACYTRATSLHNALVRVLDAVDLDEAELLV